MEAVTDSAQFLTLSNVALPHRYRLGNCERLYRDIRTILLAFHKYYLARSQSKQRVVFAHTHISGWIVARTSLPD